MNQTLDCMGLACPQPVINAKKAAEAFTEDGTLTILVDNDIAVKNLTKLGGSMGFKVESRKKGEGAFEVDFDVKLSVLDKDKGDAAAEEIAASCTIPGAKSVVVLSSRFMGTGDEKLGAALMKAFIYALTNLGSLPDTILAYNGGAYITTEGSDSLEDLKALEKAGVEIKTCGTCLDFYGLKEKLAVGSVTNMYDIVETLAGAGRIIRP
ncbi:MAG: sulfurtransferase-like selenium metabolism protein YedF [Lachnospiraceae bacterium]|nr:sulfurtransferase-like selenium metabolism protein YedF [Lachnospiraceae bacterium]